MSPAKRSGAGPSAAPAPPDGGNGSGLHPALPSADDLWLFGEGRHERLWEVLGARATEVAGRPATAFSVWAPNAQSVHVVGEWNGWSGHDHPLERLHGSGVWGGIVEDVGPRTPYKYEIVGADGVLQQRADPMARLAEHAGGMASVVFDSEHRWGDDEWMATRPQRDPLRDRLSIYEVHLGSWRRTPEGESLSYRDLAPLLADHVTELGFTHVELLPVAEHPYEPSWGYQGTALYAPTSRFGDPDDFRWFVDHLHQRGVGVIVDWVPAHFPRDTWALARFDGTPLYEYADPRRGSHPDWGTLVFDHGRAEVRGFLIANALYWLGELHIDGLRVDAVASMLYRDYSRNPGQWTPNVHGGNEDLEAVAFLQELNTVVHRVHPGVLTIAEESTAWPGVSQPVHAGGLGFTHKWNMGWMHDTLAYWSTDPLYRRYHHHQLTFGLTYAWSEHFVLPLSHDEVVHLKGSLLTKMPGSEDQRFEHLRSLLGWMWAHPGQQLLFMGGEVGAPKEWAHDRSLDWDVLHDPRHAGIQALVAELNQLEAAHPALRVGDADPEGFAWLDADDADHCTYAFERRDPGGDDVVVCLANLAGIGRHGYRVGVPTPGRWGAALSTDDERFGGAGGWRGATVESEDVPWHGRAQSVVVTLPARSVTWLVPDG